MALLLDVRVSVLVCDSESHSDSVIFSKCYFFQVEFTFRAVYIHFYSAFHGNWSNMSKEIHGFCQNISQILKEPAHRLKQYKES